MPLNASGGFSLAFLTHTEIRFVNKPFILENTILNYHWGTKNEQAFIPRLIGRPVEADVPYAELWIGSHPKASSLIQIRNQKIPLDEAVRRNPIEFLGRSCFRQFGPALPFLFKVLSAYRPLSIQAHPDKSQAGLLHRKYPEHYPDDNHKPEMAIAIDGLTALVGFRPLPEIRMILETMPELSPLVPPKHTALGPLLVRSAVESLLNLGAGRPELLNRMIRSAEERIRKSPEISNHESLFISLRQTYTGPDPGLVLLFFLNWIQLNRHQAVFLKTGVPHAYIKGNILECMANSDNVVRAGLTPKFKDIESLKAILRYEPGPPEVYTPPPGRKSYDYPSPVPEFQCSRIHIGRRPRPVSTADKPVIMICMDGGVRIGWRNESGEHRCEVCKGQSVLIPAIVKQTVLQSEDAATLFAVTPGI